ncbi:MAG: 4-alpha-glucanotransferase [Phycisphaerae bacterium]|nr:4-alpha-glucanotransferase [Phycisphaerae bacterium]
MTDRPYLRQLADRAGIWADFIDCTGQVRPTGDLTREKLLAVLGYDASSEEAATVELQAWEQRHRSQVLESVRVVIAGESALRLAVRLTEESAGIIDWRLHLSSESGSAWSADGQWAIQPPGGEVSLALPINPEPGYYRLQLELSNSRQRRVIPQQLIVVPPRCYSPAQRLQGQRGVGIWTNLYSLRSARNWGVGDFGDLQQLLRWTGEQGMSFVGLNPLHALRNTGMAISPYMPLSRLFRNSIYLDLPAIPEWSRCSAAREAFDSPEMQQQLHHLRQSELVEYETIAALQRPLLRQLHRTFRQQPVAERAAAYSQYLQKQGEALLHFATFQTLEEYFQRIGQAAGGWSCWPAEYRQTQSPQIAEFRRAHAEEIDFHCWVQFEIERQLGALATTAKEAGLAVGLYQDLAIGAGPDGSEPWAYPELFLSGAAVGSPPDPFSPSGQNWALPPIHPQRLRDSGYWYWIQLLRSTLQHAGALRIDHVMGVTRQFWIPQGLNAAEGAYVSYPQEELLGILALESQRHQAIIVGEDLGTVPPGFREVLERWGLLSSQVVYFERDYQGEFIPAERYSHRALVTVNTHDLAPIRGYWLERDLHLRRQAGILDKEEDYQRLLAERQRDRQALQRLLQREGLGDELSNESNITELLHRFLLKCPSPLIGLSLDDLAGEIDPVNLPGVSPAKYPNWSRRMQLSIEQIFTRIHREADAAEFVIH